MRLPSLLALALLLRAGIAAGAERVEFARADGAQVAAMHYAPSSGACQGIALISHGAGGSEKGYAYLGRALAAHGYLALAVGHRESGPQALRSAVARAGLRDGLTQLVSERAAYLGRFADLAAARQWAAPRCSGKAAILLGHSMGAATTMFVAGARNTLDLAAPPELRFDAYVALSPQGVGLLFPEHAWRDIEAPVLMLTGTRDSELGGLPWTTRTAAFADLPPGCKWLGVIRGATHMHFAGNGASGRNEALTLETLFAFLDGVRAGRCNAPANHDRIDIQAK